MLAAVPTRAFVWLKDSVTVGNVGSSYVKVYITADVADVADLIAAVLSKFLPRWGQRADDDILLYFVSSTEEADTEPSVVKETTALATYPLKPTQSLAKAGVTPGCFLLAKCTGAAVAGIEGRHGGGDALDGAVDRLSRLKIVSFERATEFEVVRYEDMDKSYPPLRRPSDFASLVARLERCGLYSPLTHGLCYFPDDDMTSWAENRIRLDADSFAAWSECDVDFVRLPRVWIYPRVDGKSPEKAPVSSTAAGPAEGDDKSAATPSTTRERRAHEFRESLVELDGKVRGGCLIPGCNVSFDKSLAQAEAAHIIPRCILDFNRRSKGWPVYKSLVDAAEFVRLNIDTPCNGMLLCVQHHTTFDAYQWTVDPATSILQVAPGADGGQGDFAGKLLDFSHRPGLQRPTPKVWAAYNDHIFTDRGAQLRAAAPKEKKPSAARAGLSSPRASGGR